jgi:hypothetical protein
LAAAAAAGPSPPHQLATCDRLLDRCCHYNKSGHAALAGLFATMVRDLDDGRLDETPGRLD